MKTRVLILLALAAVILTAGAGKTLANYTTEATFSFSIQPAAPSAQATASDDAEAEVRPDAVQPEAEAEPESSASVPAENTTVQTSEDTAAKTPQQNE